VKNGRLKFQIANPKFQTNPKFQIPMSKKKRSQHASF
jgi:hypothetical protein